MFGQTTVRNISQPALYPVLPPARTANGTALVIAPGGAFLSLSFDSEGLPVAGYLAERGITCFVLTYRLDPTPREPGAFLQVVGKRFASARPGMTRGDVIDSQAPPLAQADGLAALRYVRTHAAEYGVDPKRHCLVNERLLEPDARLDVLVGEPDHCLSLPTSETPTNKRAREARSCCRVDGSIPAKSHGRTGKRRQNAPT